MRLKKRGSAGGRGTVIYTKRKATVTASYLLHKHHICYSSTWQINLPNTRACARTHARSNTHTHTHWFSWQRLSGVSYSVPHIGHRSRKKTVQCQPNTQLRFREDWASASICGDQINCPTVCLQWDLCKTGEVMRTWKWIKQWINAEANLGVKASSRLFAWGNCCTYLIVGEWVGGMISVKKALMDCSRDLRFEMFISYERAETYQYSASERLSRDHDTGPVFDRSHPSHLASRGLLLLISTLRSVCCRIVGWVVHLLSLLQEKKICVKKWSILNRNKDTACFRDKGSLQEGNNKYKLNVWLHKEDRGHYEQWATLILL